MGAFNPKQGIGTLVNHIAEGNNALNAHVTPNLSDLHIRFSRCSHRSAALFRRRAGIHLHPPQQPQPGSDRCKDSPY